MHEGESDDHGLVRLLVGEESKLALADHSPSWGLKTS